MYPHNEEWVNNILLYFIDLETNNENEKRSITP